MTEIKYLLIYSYSAIKSVNELLFFYKYFHVFEFIHNELSGPNNQINPSK